MLNLVRHVQQKENSHWNMSLKSSRRLKFADQEQMHKKEKELINLLNSMSC